MNKLTVGVLVALISVTLMGCGQKNVDSGSDDITSPNEEVAVVENPNTVENGDLISIDYTGSSEEAGIFDTSIEETAKEAGNYNEQRPYKPLEFTVGAGMMIPGMETGVVGMKLDESKTLVIPAAEAYGEWTEERVQELPVSNFEDAGITPTEGEMYNFGIAQGKVLEITDEIVRLDFNNPLAGQELTFEVTVKSIAKAGTVQ